MPDSPSTRSDVLLPKEAIWAAEKAWAEAGERMSYGEAVEVGIWGFIDYHRTEGREALEDHIAQICIQQAGSDWPEDRRQALGRWFASAIVDDIFGGRSC